MASCGAAAPKMGKTAERLSQKRCNNLKREVWANLEGKPTPGNKD